VHRAAFALAVAGLTAVQLGHHTVQVGAFGDAVAVAAMGRNDPVTAGRARADANGDRLLADVAVHDAVNLAGAIVVRGAFLEAPDGEHLAQHLTLLVGGRFGERLMGMGAIPFGPVRALHDGRASADWQPEDYV